MNAHPASALFPLMGGVELDALVEDIREHGLIEPITLADGLILDGRNRLRACELAGVEPRFVDWAPLNGQTAAEWVVSMNLHRRHLTTGQRAALALDLLPHLEAEARERMLAGKTADPVTEVSQGRSVEKAAELVGVGRTTVTNAKAIQKRDESGKIIDRMRAGELNVDQAKRAVGYAGDTPDVLQQTARDKGGKDQPAIYYGKGDKFKEATEPLRRYLRAWESRDFKFEHIAPREAKSRLAKLRALSDGIDRAMRDLENRSVVARVRL